LTECRGHLNPRDPDVRLQRLPVDDRLGELARHVWVGRWDIPGGQTRRQQVLTYPGCNIAVMPSEAALHGPALKLGNRDLCGKSWVVGVLLQPAAARTLPRTPPRQLVDSSEPLPAGPWREIRELMTTGTDGEVVEVLERWLLPYAELVDETGRLVNAACQVAEHEPAIVTSAALAERLGVADRTLRRRTHRGHREVAHRTAPPAARRRDAPAEPVGVTGGAGGGARLRRPGALHPPLP